MGPPVTTATLDAVLARTHRRRTDNADRVHNLTIRQKQYTYNQTIFQKYILQSNIRSSMHREKCVATKFEELFIGT